MASYGFPPESPEATTASNAFRLKASACCCSSIIILAFILIMVNVMEQVDAGVECKVPQDRGMWYDAPGKTEFSFICKYEASNKSSGTVGEVGKCKAGWEMFEKSCYKWFEQETTQKARRMCLEHNANLLSIHSAKENEFAYDFCKEQFRERYNKKHAACRIGFYEDTPGNVEDASEDWKWYDGSPVNYTNWAIGCEEWNCAEPNDWSDEPCGKSDKCAGHAGCGDEASVCFFSHYEEGEGRGAEMVIVTSMSGSIQAIILWSTLGGTLFCLKCGLQQKNSCAVLTSMICDSICAGLLALGGLLGMLQFIFTGPEESGGVGVVIWAFVYFSISGLLLTSALCLCRICNSIQTLSHSGQAIQANQGGFAQTVVGQPVVGQVITK